MKMPKVAVVMPVRNAEKTLRAAMDSIFYQTYPNIDLIVVNDGSTDGSEAIINSMASESKFTGGFRLVNVPFQGERNPVNNISRALNLGCRTAIELGAEFIARMDADDLCDMTRIEKQVQAMSARKLGLCGTHATIVQGDTILEHFHPRIPQGKERTWLLKFNYFIHGSVMMRADVLQKVCFYDTEKLVEDYDLWLRIANTAEVGILEEPLYILTRSETSWSADKASEIYNVAKGYREFWSKAWGIPIPNYDLPGYCTVPELGRVA